MVQMSIQKKRCVLYNIGGELIYLIYIFSTPEMLNN